MKSRIARRPPKNFHPGLGIVAWRAALALGLLFMLAWSLPARASPVVDGWPIGDAYLCDVPQCEPYLGLAVEGLASRTPDHAAIVEVTLHRYGVILGTDGKPLRYLSDRPSIALFRLADGSARALGVGFVGVAWGEPSVFHWGPTLNFQPPGT